MAFHAAESERHKKALAAKQRESLDEALLNIRAFPAYDKNPHLVQAVKSLETAIGGMK